jgi:N-dimethylarginine dimethylaminohydrolase
MLSGTVDDAIGDKTKPSIPPEWITYEDELELIWGMNWGAQSEIGRLEEVIVSRPGPELSPPNEEMKWHAIRHPIDWKKAAEQHDALIKVLKDEGITVHYDERPASALMKGPYGVQLSRNPGLRDPGVVVNGGAIIGRMAMAFRRGEEVFWAKKISQLGCPILYTVRGTGIFEGGNVVWLDPFHVCIGIGARTNIEGVNQITPILRASKVEEIRSVSIPYALDNYDWPAGGWPHLDCVFGYVAPNLAVIYPAAVGYDFVQYLRLKKVRMIEALPDEARDAACNTLALEPGKIIMNTAGPHLRRQLEREKIDVITVEMSEFALHGGGPHCQVGCLIRQAGPSLES